MYCSIIVVALFSLLFRLSISTSLLVKPGSCLRHECESGQKCVPDKKDCVKQPCPQYRCEVEDPCNGDLCERHQRCVPYNIQCITTPCPTYRCEPINPCSVKVCRKGYVCVTTQCKALHCRPQARCVKKTTYRNLRSCPPTKERGFSTCVYNDCTKSGCIGGKICCPRSCGGNSCQTPV